MLVIECSSHTTSHLCFWRKNMGTVALTRFAAMQHVVERHTSTHSEAYITTLKWAITAKCVHTWWHSSTSARQQNLMPCLLWGGTTVYSTCTSGYSSTCHVDQLQACSTRRKAHKAALRASTPASNKGSASPNYFKATGLHCQACSNTTYSNGLRSCNCFSQY